ncbi:acetate--CoA ligase family protein [Halomonas sp. HMF6819]|uniref:acetate--CoA ligase family protein n=1 Tax=Halomonas sp. HMF6819 TaxID=3373085 RepID=UPI0037A18903
MSTPNDSNTPPRSLKRLFEPRSIAVAGASTNLESIGGQPIKHLLDAGYAGNIYPINPKYDRVADLVCYPGIDDLPEAPDVIVIAVAANRALDMIKAAGEKGIPYAIVFSSGFAETGDEGHAAQAELRSVARAAGITLIGPNCQGLMNIAENIRIGFGTPYSLDYHKGGVCMSSQSGAFGNSLLMALSDEGIGFRHYISTGNEAQTTSLDCLEYFIDDPQTQVVTGYVEGFQDAYRLRQLGQKALASNKPVVLWKVGNSDAGARAASSHTANLAGASTYYEAAFRQFGIVSANDVGDMADCVRALLTNKRPKGNGVAVLSVSGGAGIAMADRCAEQELTLPDFSEQTLDELRPLLPGFASLSNPMDITAGVLSDPASFATALRVVIKDPAVDMLGLCLAALSGKVATLIAEEIAQVAAESDVPILVAWNAPTGTADDAYRILEDANIPRYGSPVRSARGFGAIWRFTSAALAQHETAKVRPHQAPDNAKPLNEYSAKQLLQTYSLPVTREVVASNANEAVSAAQEIGYPVVMKILSKDIAHKSDAGGVLVGLDSDEGVQEGFERLARLPATLGENIAFEGVLIQEMVSGGTEVILGAVNDPGFGPVIMVGAGGVYTEVFEDVAFAIAPINRRQAQDLIDSTRISRVLRGARGRPPGDIEALVDTLVQLSKLAMAESERFTEIDINPLIVLPEGDGARIVDAFVRTS